MKEIQHGLFGDDAAEPEEGKLPTERKGLTTRERTLVSWMRANGPVDSTNVPLGFKVRDLEHLAMAGVLVAEGAQVRTFRVSEIVR